MAMDTPDSAHLLHPGSLVTDKNSSHHLQLPKHVHAVPLDNEEQVFPDPQWRTGMRARFPWNGAIALFIVILCANSSIIVLLVSDGKKQKHWAEKIGPSVLLSAFNGIANIAFGVAIANGVAITWWRKALRGATIKELHRSWQFSSSIKDIVLYGRYFNFIALAALAAKLTIIDGVLLQKAAGTTTSPDPTRDVTLEVYVNETMPFTATFVDSYGNVSPLPDWFGSDVHLWSRSGGTYPGISYECDGTCLFDVSGTGFAIDCQSEEVDMNYGTAVSQETTALSQSGSVQLSLDATANRTLFEITFQAIYGSNGGEGDYSQIEMNLTSTKAKAIDGDSTSCPGKLIRHSCKLRPAVISYPVTVENTPMQSDTNTFVSNTYLGYNATSWGGQVGYWSEALQTYYTVDEDSSLYMNGTFYNSSLRQLKDYKVVAHKDIFENPSSSTGNSPTVLGGIAKVLNQYFAGTSSMHYDRGAFSVNHTGAAGILPFNSSRVTSDGCDFEFRDPLDYSIQQINALMFVMATDPWYSNTDNNQSLTRQLKAQQYGLSIHYQTNRSFMYGALASILFCVLCILPSYWGYWQLGRDVTLGPFEIANAFRAPILDHPTVANAPVKDLIREVGQREVKYGAMVQGDASNRLAIAEPDAVRRVHPSIHDRRM
ncbi:hypothetical protein E4T49_06685 [Aureobasidium sp. EXF-10728]|nr:hypothetical protein E4T49_06685 [Aureobasidium sp. EXF-10728]